MEYLLFYVFKCTLLFEVYPGSSYIFILHITRPQKFDINFYFKNNHRKIDLGEEYSSMTFNTCNTHKTFLCCPFVFTPFSIHDNH